ncbi:hypothetical protein COLO4_04888 [Corchorus olitorius]|uniref:Uncharacterized protein n=1 Tax=Corchorus olitorius TaxID=93759 RepID=A0A1R3KSG7_9ROSI|nr:hypothetical protein COLO4_04888 [Corchorus olitorius]
MTHAVDLYIPPILKSYLDSATSPPFDLLVLSLSHI